MSESFPSTIAIDTTGLTAVSDWLVARLTREAITRKLSLTFITYLSLKITK